MTCADVPTLIDAIRRLVVRGAPLLGIAGAYGVALAAARGEDVPAAADEIAAARPTAVNLGWGARRALGAYQRAVAAQDPCRSNGTRHWLPSARPGRSRTPTRRRAPRWLRSAWTLVPDGARILTHCNTGSLVTAGEGTAFGLVLAAHRAGLLDLLWVDETRPLLQGSRLTAYEAGRTGVPFRVLADSAAASLMAARPGRPGGGRGRPDRGGRQRGQQGRHLRARRARQAPRRAVRGRRAGVDDRLRHG